MNKKAADAYVKSVALFGEVKEAEELRNALTEKGIREMWLKRIEQVDVPARRESFSAQWRSLIHLRLGKREKALDWLEESYRRRDRWMINIKHSPKWTVCVSSLDSNTCRTYAIVNYLKTV